MPCYLFTYHAYGSWMPDRQAGYVKRKRGVLPPDAAMGRRYRKAMTDAEVQFGDAEQRGIIDAVLEAMPHIAAAAHFIATETTHVHALVSWSSEQRTWLQNRSSVKKAITLALQRQIEHRRWLSDSASRKQVKDREHFEHLIHHYLPSHRGWKWDEHQGYFQ